jgi:hypothetical protein
MELLGFVTFCNKVYLSSQAPVSEKYLTQYFHYTISLFQAGLKTIETTSRTVNNPIHCSMKENMDITSM